MIEVKIDGIVLETPLNGNELIGDVIGALARDLDTNRCVIKVTLDGADITGNVEKHNEGISAFNNLDIVTGEKTVLALETLDSIEEFNESLIRELGVTAGEFRIGDIEKSNNMLVRCLDALQVIAKSTESISTLLGTKFEELSSPKGSAQEMITKINSLFDEMIEAQTQSDTILLADLIEYEMVPQMEDWKTLFVELRQAGAVA